ncbi:hypothetical protein [Hymenobacter sp. UYP22]|uniref:hypothetical protein n=1 Tax=Hymenobacter sp. UYP22 TaxID=3156348 RepID=UPI003398A863
MNSRLLGILLGILWLTSCRSTQIPAFFPAAQQYQPHLVLPSRAESEALSRPSAAVRPASSRKPVAGSLLRKSVATAADTSRRPAKKPKGNQPTLVITGTDTLVGYPVTGRIPSTITSDTSVIPSDPETTFVNVIGGVLTATGLISLAVSTDNKSGTSSSWENLYLGIVALTLVPIGIALLLYQGKNGRLRLKREARRQARADAQAPHVAAGTTSSSKKAKRHPLRKLAAILLIAGALLLVGGLLTAPYGMLFFGLPGTTALLIGLILMVASL